MHLMMMDSSEPRPSEPGASGGLLKGRTPSHAEQLRTLLEGVRFAALCTNSASVPGYPFGSVVEYALDRSAAPIFLLSDLAEHTVSFKADPRASLLVCEPFGSDDPVTLARATLLGTMEAVDDAQVEEAKTLFLKRHPNARTYASFADFHAWRLKVTSARYIGGFGRMSWVPVEEYRDATPDPLHAISRDLVENFNEDQSPALLDLVRRGTEAKDATGARMTELDRYGFDVTVVSRGGGLRRIRLGFLEPVRNGDEVRKGFARLLEAVRSTP